MAAADGRAAGIARALGRIPSGLFVVTAGRGDDLVAMLASWVQQAGFTPPAITLALQADRPLLARIRRERRFCLSILPSGRLDLLRTFATSVGPGTAAFTGIAMATTPGGHAYPRDCHAWLECELLGEARWSDHVVVGAAVRDGERLDAAAPVVHVRRTGQSY
jgi:flavin reductase (DIM6/NTAB) family NADH-FMN oxidoreductase RutF